VGTAFLDWLVRKKRFRWITPESLERARVYFRRRAGWTIFITRFLIVALGGPVNFLAGLEEYPYKQFLFWDVSGQILSVLLSLGLGSLFAASWEEVASLFGAFSSLVLAAIVAFALSIFFVRKIRQQRLARATKAATREENRLAPQLLQGVPKQKTGHLPISD
jgi:membrane-associated protein